MVSIDPSGVVWLEYMGAFGRQCSGESKFYLDPPGIDPGESRVFFMVHLHVRLLRTLSPDSSEPSVSEHVLFLLLSAC